MSRIIRILSEAQKELLGRTSHGARTEDLGTPAAPLVGHVDELSAGGVLSQGDDTKTVDNVLDDFERIKEELMQLQEEQKEVLLKLREIVDKL